VPIVLFQDLFDSEVDVASGNWNDKFDFVDGLPAEFICLCKSAVGRLEQEDLRLIHNDLSTKGSKTKLRDLFFFQLIHTLYRSGISVGVGQEGPELDVARIVYPLLSSLDPDYFPNLTTDSFKNAMRAARAYFPRSTEPSATSRAKRFQR
jgi:hypothetical protein